MAEVCIVDGCLKEALTRGLCSGHYHRLLRYGNPLGGRFFNNQHNVGKRCSVMGCANKAKTKGLCSSHYHRLQRYGNPLGGEYYMGRKPSICKVFKCNSMAVHCGFCQKHYQRNRKYGDPRCIKVAHDGIAKRFPEMAQILYGMKDRCTNPNSYNYKWYGGRGIKVCKRWSGAYGLKHFVEDMGERPLGKTRSGRAEYSIDRIDPNGDYCPENCRWATWAEQRANH